MARKKNKSGIILVLIVLAIFAFSNQQSRESSPVEVSARYFDEEGDEIFLEPSLSSIFFRQAVVIGDHYVSPTRTNLPSNVEGVQLKILLTNTGNVPITFDEGIFNVEGTKWNIGLNGPNTDIRQAKGNFNPKQLNILPGGSDFVETDIIDISELYGEDHLIIELDYFVDTGDRFDTYRWEFDREYGSPDVYQEDADIHTAQSVTYPGKGALQVTYDKPDSAISAKWLVKHGRFNPYNISLPSSCFDYYSDKIEMRIDTQYNWAPSGASPQSRPYCYNGGWVAVGQLDSSFGSYFAGGSRGHQGRMWDGNWGTSTIATNDGTPGFDGYWLDTSAHAGRIFEEAVIWEVPVECTQDSDCIVNPCCITEGAFPANQVPDCTGITCENIGECPQGPMSNTLDCINWVPICYDQKCEVKYEVFERTTN